MPLPAPWWSRPRTPGLNPQLLEKAIAAHLPALTPNFTRIRRRELLDASGNIFR